MSTRGFIVALIAPLALVTACGDDVGNLAQEPAPSTPPVSSIEPSGLLEELDPQCITIWQAGETLPGSYQGCFEDDVKVRADGRYCEFGKKLYTYADRFYAVRQGRIAEASEPFAQDAGYQDALSKCSG